MRKYSNRLFKNPELWLSIAGVLMVWLMPLLTGSSDLMWRASTSTALGVGVLHGIVFLIVRRKRRIERTQAILEVQEMMSDVVKNQLAVIGMYLPNPSGDPELKAQVVAIEDTVNTISGVVDHLSEESLHSWKSRYHEAISNCTEVAPLESKNEITLPRAIHLQNPDGQHVFAYQ